MSIFGTAKVTNGKHVIKGDFHTVSANTPIRNEDRDRKPAGITNPRQIVHLHAYGGEAVFFENLGHGKIYGTRCDNSACEFPGTVYPPFRIDCPDCLVRATVIDLTEVCRQKATIHTFMVCERSGAFNTLEKPIQFINVEFEGVSTILMSYLSVGEPKIGQRVVPIFKTVDPTDTITDLSWVEKGTTADRLPANFSFG